MRKRRYEEDECHYSAKVSYCAECGELTEQGYWSHDFPDLCHSCGDNEMAKEEPSKAE